MVQPSANRLLVESQRGAVNGIASLDATGKVPDAQIPDRLGTTALDDTYAQAVSIRKLGVKGDGTNETAAIKAALVTAAGKPIYLPAGTYVTNETLELTTKTVLLSDGDAWLQSGATPTGLLSTGACLVWIKGDDAGLHKVNVKAPAVPLTNDDGESKTVLIRNTTTGVKRAFVHGCRFIGPGLRSILVAGTGTLDTRITENHLEDAGSITYSYAGASRTYCAGNKVIRSSVNGLSGTGNSTEAYGNVVADNTVIDCFRIGIEDWQAIRGTIVRNNTVINAGTGNPSTNSGFGLSLVGRATVAVGNVIEDFKYMGIETSGDNAVITGNTIIQKSAGNLDLGQGISSTGTSGSSGATIKGNRIERCEEGVAVVASPGHVTIEGNHFKDIRRRGINFQPASGNIAKTSLTIIGNEFQYTIPVAATSALASTIQRYTFDFYTGSGTAPVSIIGNTVFYWATAGGGTAADVIGQISTNNVLVTGNTFDANNITTPAAPKVGATGATNTGLILTNNRFLRGATFNTSSYVGAIVYGNTPGIGTGAAAVTGSIASGAAFADLLAKLDSLGILKNSTTA